MTKAVLAALVELSVDANLAFGTIQQNADDAIRMGELAKGERNGAAKLTADIVLAIRHDDTSSVKELADRYGITDGHVSNIKYGRVWKHVGGPILTTGGGHSLMAKLTEDDVRQIKGRPGDRCVDLAVEFGCSSATISALRREKSWQWVT